MALSTGLGGSVGRLRRVAAALVTVVAAVLATAGSAAAYTPNPIPLNSPWVAKACCGASAPGWYKDAFGIIHLQGAVTHGAVVVGHGSRGLPSLIGTLPPAARPTRDVFTIVHTFNGTYADLAIAPNGQISVIDPRPPAVTDLSFVSFEGITYQPAAKLPTRPIAVNGVDWSPSAGFGSTTPSWYKDGSGIVHLEGAAKQISTAGSNPSLIGTLPAAAAPARTIYTIVHTFNGTYADLVITNHGGIFIEGAPPGPAPPAVTDLSFVSLEGVSYYPLALFNHIGQLNTGNWSPACCGSGPNEPSEPGWVEDNAGIVHLQGAATQTSAGGPNANLVATLPTIIAPTRTVFTIVETNSGTYADLAIDPHGHILVIAPRPPAAEDLGFLSLEGITYQPSVAAGPHALSLTRSGDVMALLRKPRAL